MELDICTSESGNGCGSSFAQKTSAGMCAKCQKLATLKKDSEEYQEWQAMKQCSGCGVAWKNLQTNLCGRCTKLALRVGPSPDLNPPGDDLTRSALDTSRQARAQAFEARLRKQPSPAPIHTTAGLSAAKASNTPTGENKVFISVECRVKSGSKRDQKNTDPDCGSWGKPWPKAEYLSVVLDDSLEALNLHWAKVYGMALKIDEVEFRLAGNKRFLPGAVNDQVGIVYNQYMTGEMGLYYGPKEIKKSTAPKNQYAMALELYINKPKFLERRDEQQGLTDLSQLNPTRKRSATATSLAKEFVPQQKKRAAGLLLSWLPTASSDSVAVSSTVRLVKARCTCDDTTGQVEIIWVESDSVDDGFLGKGVFASGTTKHLAIGSDLFVAKRFYNVGAAGEITPAENEKHLRSELVRLKTAFWMLTKFKEHAKKTGTEIHNDIVVSDGFLAREVDGPSPASGLPPFENDAPVWLVEPRRTTSVKKYSGTLVHPSHSDNLGITLVAFAHFTYEASLKHLVFADIQGSPMNMNNRDTLVLFDLMSHSHSSDSGIGDHGPEGIASFLEQHKCNHVCTGLKLAPLKVDEASDKNSHGKEPELDQLDSDQ